MMDVYTKYYDEVIFDNGGPKTTYLRMNYFIVKMIFKKYIKKCSNEDSNLQWGMAKSIKKSIHLEK